MKRLIAPVGALLLAILWSTAQAEPGGTSTAQGKSVELDARVVAIFEQACEQLKDAAALHCRARLSFDELEVGPGGTDLLVNYSGTVDMAAVRPDKLRASLRTDNFSLDVIIDGKTAAVSSPHADVYGIMPVEGSIGEMLDTVDMGAGFSPPLADFLAADAFERFMNGAQWASYVGTPMVMDSPCHQLLVRQDDVDWQVWIDVESKLPRKLSVTYRTLPLAPRFTAVITEWDLVTPTPDAEFVFAAGPDAIQVEMSRSLPRETPKGGGK